MYVPGDCNILPISACDLCYYKTHKKIELKWDPTSNKSHGAVLAYIHRI